MSLFSTSFGNLNILAVEAGDADEMVSRLTAAYLSTNVAAVGDLQVAGAGSGPKWEAWFPIGNFSGTPSLTNPVFVAAVAGNPVEARLRLLQKIAAVPFVANVFKIVVAGAGDGPTYMAIAMVSQAIP